MSVIESPKTIALRKKLNSSKIYLRNLMPTRNEVIKSFQSYKSDVINLTKFNHKLYEDPVFGKERIVSQITYAVSSGDWLLDEDFDEYTQTPVIKLTDNKSGQFIKIGFPDQSNKLIFLNEMNVYNKITQEHPGMDIGAIVNENTLYPKKKNLIKSAIALLIIGYGYLTIRKYKNSR